MRRFSGPHSERAPTFCLTGLISSHSFGGQYVRNMIPWPEEDRQNEEVLQTSSAMTTNLFLGSTSPTGLHTNHRVRVTCVLTGLEVHLGP